MSKKREKELINEFGQESLESSIVNTLVDRYEEKESNSYLGSSKRLVETATEILSSENVQEIFKAQSKYYSGIRSVKTSLRLLK